MVIDLIIDFKHFKKRESPNDYLVCPSNICEHSDLKSPEFPFNVQSLIKKWEIMIASQPRIKLIIKDGSKNQWIYVQRTKLFRFPDYITVQFIPLGDNQSTLILYSASKYGYYDFGVNESRVIKWLELLNALNNPKHL